MFARVRGERRDEERGHLDVSRGEISVHPRVSVATHAIGVARALQVVVSRLERVAEHHVLEVRLRRGDGGVDGVREDAVREGIRGAGSKRTLLDGGELFFDPDQFLGDAENRGVGRLVHEIGIFDAVTRVGERIAWRPRSTPRSPS